MPNSARTAWASIRAGTREADGSAGDRATCTGFPCRDPRLELRAHDTPSLSCDPLKFLMDARRISKRSIYEAEGVEPGVMQVTTVGGHTGLERERPRWSTVVLVIAALLLVFELDRKTNAAPIQHLYYLPILFA